MQFYKIRFDYETGNIIDDCNSLECLGGGGKGGKSSPVYIPQPAPAVTQPAPPPPAPEPPATFVSPVTESAYKDAGELASEEALKVKEAKRKGAKSLQIPLTDNTTATSDAAKAVGTV